MKRLLMLWPDKNQPFPRMIAEQYSSLVDIENLYRPANRLKRIIRRGLSEIGGSTIHFCDKWIDSIDKYDSILIHANPINRTLPHYLRKKGYKGRIIFWYWNPVDACLNPNRVDREACEIWSFSRSDCEKYGLKYNSTYSFIPSSEDENSEDIAAKDVFFIGLDKGRLNQLQEVKQFLESHGISCDLRVVKDNTSISDSDLYTTPLTYEESLKITRSSKVLLELLQKGQTGESLRVMEAIHFSKKLITNNTSIKAEPYYNPANIFVLEGAPDERLLDFLNRPMEPVSLRMKEYFTFPNWLKRFQ